MSIRWVLIAVAALLGCSGGTMGTASRTTLRTSATTAAPDPVSAVPTSGEQLATSTSAVAVAPWVIDTATCDDPAGAAAVLSEPVRITALAPSRGLPGAAATPVIHALQVGLAAASPATSFSVIADPTDPQARAELFAAADADLFVGIVGSEASSTAAEVLARQCVPQLFSLGDASRLDDPDASPWTMSAAIAATVESNAFMADVKATSDGEGDGDGDPAGPRVGVFLTIADSADSTEAALRDAADSLGLSVDLVSRVDPFDSLGIEVAANTLVAASLDAVVVASSGLDCISFLQAWDKALGEPTEAAPVRPTVYLAGACASRAVARGAGEAGQGAISSAVFVDVDDPTVAAEPQVTEYLDAMRGAGFAHEASFGVAGWVVAQATTAVLRHAAATAAGLSRVSIIEAARGLTFESDLLRPGISIETNGGEDPFAFDTVQLVTYLAVSDTYEDRGAAVRR